MKPAACSGHWGGFCSLACLFLLISVKSSASAMETTQPIAATEAWPGAGTSALVASTESGEAVPGQVRGRQILQQDDSVWTLRTGASGFQRCLDIPNSNAVNENQLQQYDCNGSSAQSFTGVNRGGANGFWFLLRSRVDPSKCVDVRAFDESNGASVILWDCKGVDNQLFAFWPVQGANYTYTITPWFAPTKCLHVGDGAADKHVPLQLWDCAGLDAQKFMLVNSGSAR